MNINHKQRKLPPNFEITTPNIENLIRYGKSLGDSHIVYAGVFINGKEISKDSNIEVSISQKVLEHNSFKIICPPEIFNEREKYPLKNSKRLLNSTISVHMIQFGKPASIFTGIITSIEHFTKENGANCLILIGESPTILMDQEVKCKSFENMTLEEIYNKVVDPYKNNNFTFDFKPFLKTKIPYTVQNETDYQFLQRLAIRYGEWLNFSGFTLFLGGLGNKITEMLQNRDFYEYKISMKAASQRFSLLGYDHKQAQIYQLNSDNIFLPEPVNPYQFQAVKSSKEMFSDSPLGTYHESLLEGGEPELNELIKRLKQSKESTVFITAKSHNPELRLNDIVKMKAWVPNDEIFNLDGFPIESYRITEIQHFHDPANGYTNSFTAVACQQEIPPYMNYKAVPQCIEQSAVITDINDPLGMNRVRVQFDFQKQENAKSPWIEILQGHSGSGKGNHWVHEVGDNVLVGFKGGNAEVPYVKGALYNGKQQSGYHTPDNNLKVMKTRSGHTIILDDTDNKLSITITDSAKNIIYLDTMEKSIKISAPETIEIIAKNLKINIEEDITTNVGRDIKTIAKNNISQDSGKKTIIASGDNTEISANKELDIYGKKKLIGYTDGLTEFGAKKQMHVYGGNSLITALNTIEYKAPNMNKLAQSGEFKYGKEKEIVEARWINKEENKKYNISPNEKAGILVKTRNYEEGDKVTVIIKEKNNQTIRNGEKEVKLEGFVNSEGYAILKEVFYFDHI